MKVQIEKQDDGSYIAYNTTGNMLQLIGTGETVAEAKSDFMNSMQEMIESCKEECTRATSRVKDFTIVERLHNFAFLIVC